jgi:fatty-acid desaturase
MIRKLNSYFWRVFLPLHLCFIYLLWTTTFTWTHFALILLLWTLLAGYGIGAGYHRLLSHRSFKTKKWIEYLLSYFGVLSVQGSPLYWVALHKGYHHPYSDTEKDFHSPIHGRLYSYFLWTCVADLKLVELKYAGRMCRDWIQTRVFHMHYFAVIWATWISIYFLNQTLFAALILTQVLTLHQEFCVNYFCHTKNRGYRNFPLSDNSVNIYLFGLIFWGVGFHNNHHARPTSYDFGYLPSEIDLTKYLVRLVKTT